MIKIIGRRIIVPDSDRVLGVEGDNDTLIYVGMSPDNLHKYFGKDVTGSDVGCVMKLQIDDTDLEPIVLLYESGSDEWCVWKGYIQQAVLTKPGAVTAQFGFSTASVDGEGNVTEPIMWQTDSAIFEILETIGSSEPVDGSEFDKLFSEITGTVAAIQAASETAKNAALSAASSADAAMNYASDSEQNKNDILSLKEAVSLLANEASTAVSEAKSAAESARSSLEEAEGIKESASLSASEASECAAAASESASAALASEKKTCAYEESAREYSENARLCAENASISMTNSEGYMNLAEEASEKAKEYSASAVASAEIAQNAKNSIDESLSTYDSAISGIYKSLSTKSDTDHGHEVVSVGVLGTIDLTEYAVAREEEVSSEAEITSDTLSGGGVSFDISIRGYAELEFSSDTYSFIEIDGVSYDCSYGNVGSFSGYISDTFSAYVSAGSVTFTKFIAVGRGTDGFMSAEDKEKLDGIDGALSEKADKSEVLEDLPALLTDFDVTYTEYTARLSDTVVNVYQSDPVIIHCAGETVGFTYSVKGWTADGHITINGATASYEYTGSNGNEAPMASDVVIAPTYMESDIIIEGAMTEWAFSGITKRSIKGISELEEKMGDISTVDLELDYESERPLANKSICSALDEKADNDKVFENIAFGWTEFENTTDAYNGVVYDSKIQVHMSEPIVIHCAGETIGFTYSVRGWGDATITINGITTTYEYVDDGSGGGCEMAVDVVVPSTYMESDIVFTGVVSGWTFTDMTKQAIKGMGGISSALDSIIAIENELIGGDA